MSPILASSDRTRLGLFHVGERRSWLATVTSRVTTSTSAAASTTTCTTRVGRRSAGGEEQHGPDIIGRQPRALRAGSLPERHDATTRAIRWLGA